MGCHSSINQSIAFTSVKDALLVCEEQFQLRIDCLDSKTAYLLISSLPRKRQAKSFQLNCNSITASPEELINLIRVIFRLKTLDTLSMIMPIENITSTVISTIGEELAQNLKIEDLQLEFRWTSESNKYVDDQFDFSVLVPRWEKPVIRSFDFSLTGMREMTWETLLKMAISLERTKSLKKTKIILRNTGVPSCQKGPLKSILKKIKKCYIDI